MKPTLLRLLSVAVLIAAASCVHGAVIFEDNFDAIGDGEPDPAWMPLTGGPWVVQSKQYASLTGGQIWEWNIVKDLVAGDCIVSADMIVPGSGIIVRVQNPMEGQNPTCLVVLFEHYGIDVYRVSPPGTFDYVGSWKGSPPEYERLWSDIYPRTVNVYSIFGHRGEWARLTVSIIGDKLSASAYLIDSPSVTAQVKEIAVPEVAADGYVGLYRSNNGYFPKYDNYVVSDLQPEPAAVTGRVTDSRTGAGVAGATVEVVGTGNSTVTNGTGGYTLTNVTPGPSFLRITAGGYVPKQIAVELASGPNEVNVTIDPYQSIGVGKALGPGVSVGMIGVVTAVFADYNTFVIESEDRSAGITVTPINPGDLAIGEEVRAAGTIQANGVLQLSSAAERTGRDQIQIDPVATNNRDLTGAVGNPGLSNKDLLVATYGKVLAPPVTLGDGSKLIYMTDGSTAGGATVVVPGPVDTLFQDDFNAIPEGQPDPAWQSLQGGPWVVQSGEYVAEFPPWNVIKDMVAGDCVYSADMIVPNSGLILRVQNPTEGEDPVRRVLVMFEGNGTGLYVYRDHWQLVSYPQQGLWSDDLNHIGEWANLEVTMVGPRISAVAKLRSDPGVTAVMPEILLPGFYPTGYLGLYQGNTAYGNRFDNVKVTGNTPLPLPADTVQVVIPPSVTGTPTIAEGDYIRAVGIAGKGLTLGGDIRGVTIKDPDELSIVVP